MKIYIECNTDGKYTAADGKDFECITTILGENK